MEEIRRNHNDAKRSLIQSVAQKGQCILDVGCGFGGDLQKWHKCGVNINMCDPEPSALVEARSRAKNMHIRVNFYEGDIHNCPNRKLMWCVSTFLFTTYLQSKGIFFSSLREIKKRIKPGGKLIGIIPDSEKIMFRTPYRDEMGNYFLNEKHGYGDYGEKMFVHLADTPYYADGPKPEPSML